ncbi:MAG: rhodanese-like domain-containing protein [Muribaculaceae bacterium]|nr:rhodanese-like domain-containing protein [Muribaculaceae bacterium]
MMLLAALGFCSACSASDGISLLSPLEFRHKVSSDTLAVVLDVRRPAEYAEGHLPGAILIDWLDPESFNEKVTTLDKSRHYYLYCRSGRRSHEAALRMKELGFTDIADMKGGILAWKRCDLPIATDCYFGLEDIK